MSRDATFLRSPLALLGAAAVLIASAVLFATMQGPLDRSIGFPIAAGFAIAGLTFFTARIAWRHRVTKNELWMIAIGILAVLVPLLR